MPRILKITVALICFIGMGAVGAIIGYSEAEVVASRTQPLLAIKYMVNIKKLEKSDCASNLWAMKSGIDEAIIEYYGGANKICFICSLDKYAFLNDTKSVKQLLAFRIYALERERACNDSEGLSKKIEFFKRIESEIH